LAQTLALAQFGTEFEFFAILWGYGHFIRSSPSWGQHLVFACFASSNFYLFFPKGRDAARMPQGRKAILDTFQRRHGRRVGTGIRAEKMGARHMEGIAG
jgi:hypothetical protein